MHVSPFGVIGQAMRSTSRKPARELYTAAMETGTLKDTLHVAVEATRLLGRWTMVGQRHGQGCSCCPPGLGDVAMDDVERSIVKTLKDKHAILEGRESLNLLLRDLVSRKVQGTPEQLRAFLADFGEIVNELERVQLGFY